MDRAAVAAGAVPAVLPAQGAADVKRRELFGFGAALLGAEVLARCGGTAAASSTATGDSSTDAGDSTDGGSATDAGSSSTAWATGGTAAMTAKASYPDPFASSAATACALTCAMTQGPCYDAQAETLQDISYGYAGLPVRMWFQMLDESCKPIPNAVIDIWHVSPAGKYSGDDMANENVAFCTGNDSAFISHLYFRGKQATDASGKAFFDTCFPGWYTSRTIHVHLTVRVGGQAYVTTQLFFDDALDDEVISTQTLYATRGKRDTTNSTDTVISASAVSKYLFQTAKMSDGAMLAWKTLVLRSSLTEASCSP